MRHPGGGMKIHIKLIVNLIIYIIFIMSSIIFNYFKFLFVIISRGCYNMTKNTKKIGGFDHVTRRISPRSWA